MVTNKSIIAMKNIFKNITYTLGIFSLLLFNGCKDSIIPVGEELNFTRAFTPVGLSAQISNVTTVSLSWSITKNTDHYVLEIYDGTEFIPSALIYRQDIEADVTSFSYVLPAGDTQFSARLKAISSLTGVEESKWATIEFKSAPENLFTDYTSEMTGLNSCTIRWKPGSTATDLVFASGTNQTSYPVTSGELTAGVKELTGIANSQYEIRLMNGNFVRGRINLLIEGDVLLPAGGDLAAAVKNMPSGGVLILTNGVDYPLAETDTISASIKIRGLYQDNLPIIYLMTGGGNHIFDIDPDMSLSDSVVFENVDISSYYDDAGVTRHRGVFDVENSALSLGALKFNNCIIRNSGRSAIRLRSGANTMIQYIDNVEFNNCIMYDFAWDSHYGVLNGALYGNFGNIKFTNTTAYNLRGGIINYGSGAGCLSVTVDNCTFNQVTMDASSGRYFIDFGSGSNTSTGTITISDCIFGQTSALANGVRNSTMSLSVNGSFYTSDFINVNYSIAGSMTAYAGASTALWTDPSNGDFTFLDPNFGGKDSAGDPRWRP
jgi:hypothetical protein